MREGVKRYKERSARGAVVSGIGGATILLILVIKLSETCNQVVELQEQMNTIKPANNTDTVTNTQTPKK